MTVLEPTPDHATRGSLVRRAGFLATAVGLTGAFAFSLTGIASTRGAVSPETQAAVVAAQQRSDAAETGSTTFRHGHCRHGDRARGGSAGSGRV